MVKTTVKIYVEGGGNSKALRTDCRAAFSKFLEEVGFDGKKFPRPRWVACGSRNEAFDDFRTAVQNGEDALLLVDSEDEVGQEYYGKTGNYAAWNPWGFLRNRDGWQIPQEYRSIDAHLMVRNMEAWLVADLDNLKRFYRQGFNDKQLRGMQQRIEEIEGHRLIAEIKSATRRTQKGEYDKGAHSFELLARTDPNKVMAVSPWAERFVECLKQRMQANG